MKTYDQHSVFFDKELFDRDVSLAREVSKRSAAEDYAFEEGLRFIFIASERMLSLEAAGNDLTGMLHADATIEPLFDEVSLGRSEELASIYLVRIPRVDIQSLKQTPFDIAYYLRERFNMAWVEPDVPFNALGLDDGESPPISSDSQQAIANHDYAWALRNVCADYAWKKTSPYGGNSKGNNIAVAHIDTGWRSHVDLDTGSFDWQRAYDVINPKRTKPDEVAHDDTGWGFNLGHGTKTASVILSRGGTTDRQGVGETTPPGNITGVAPLATYIPIRAIKNVVVLFHGKVATAIAYATSEQADVISMSLGGRPMRVLKKSLQDAVKENLLVVSAAGNNVKLVVWPAQYKEAIAVAASNCNDDTWSGSSRGKAVAITAPGERVWHAVSDTMTETIASGDGTSYATAHLAGAAAVWLSYFTKSHLALVLQRSSHNNLQELFRDCLTRSARDPGDWNTKKYGAGILNLEKLLETDPVGSTTFDAITNSEQFDFLRDLFAEIESTDVETVVGLLFTKNGEYSESACEFYSQEIVHFLMDNDELLVKFYNLVDEKSVKDAALWLRYVLVGSISRSYQSFLEGD